MTSRTRRDGEARASDGAIGGVTRREFVRTSALYGAGLWLAVQVPRPAAARAAAASQEPVTFSAHEWATVEAITGRIVPADHEPGAIEARCVNFIDKALAHEDAEARPVYALGLPALDAVARARFEAPFVALEPAHQDAVLASLEQGDTPAWKEPAIAPPLFFETVRVHTIVAFLADPSYGGNHGFAGWRVSGYPGPRHRMGGYTPAQVTGAAPIVPIWGEAKSEPGAKKPEPR